MFVVVRRSKDDGEEKVLKIERARVRQLRVRCFLY